MSNEKINGYELSRAWFDFCVDNRDKITPTHTALYFFIVDLCNRLGWKEKFGLPMQMAKDAIGISNYRTYSKVFNDLAEWNFISVIQESKNQYTSTIIAIVKNTKATAKAKSKAIDIALHNQSEKQVYDTVCINKPLNNETSNNETTNNLCAEDSTDGDSLDTSDLTKKILQDFGFTETRNFDKLRIISAAIREIISDGRLDYFSQQYRDYMTYKHLSGEKKHNLQTFFSDPPGWDSANWSQKIKDYAPPGKDGKILNNIKKANAVVNPFQ